MKDHEQYEVLCALAAAGQLTAEERVSFNEHILRCRTCRDKLRDLTSIALRLQIEAATRPTAASMPAGSMERFRARIIREGLVTPSEPTRRPASFALTSLAMFFVILSSLIVMPHGPRPAESVASSAVAPIPAWQAVPVSASRTERLPRSAKVPRTIFVRHHIVRHADTGADTSSLAAQRFLQTIPPNYPLFSQQSATRASLTSYPALSQSQISHFNLFRDMDDAQHRNTAGAASPGQPIDIASAGSAFDFAADIRQLHFQLPTAQ
jgi:hypothetical protein